jgi:hypothetical protein
LLAAPEAVLFASPPAKSGFFHRKERKEREGNSNQPMQIAIWSMLTNNPWEVTIPRPIFID